MLGPAGSGPGWAWCRAGGSLCVQKGLVLMLCAPSAFLQVTREDGPSGDLGPLASCLGLSWPTCKMGHPFCPRCFQVWKGGDFPGGSAGKESACNAGDLGLIPGLGRSPGEGKGYPLQYSGLENPMDGIVHGVAESQTPLSEVTVEGRKTLGCLGSPQGKPGICVCGLILEGSRQAPDSLSLCVWLTSPLLCRSLRRGVPGAVIISGNQPADATSASPSHVGCRRCPGASRPL